MPRPRPPSLTPPISVTLPTVPVGLLLVLPGPQDPAVQVDFFVRDGLLYAEVSNVGPVPAVAVVIKFSAKITGLGGRVSVNDLALFSHLAFLAAGRRIEVLIDTLEAYIARREPRELAVAIAYKDEAGKAFRRSLPHDLGIYFDLPRAVSPLRIP